MVPVTTTLAEVTARRSGPCSATVSRGTRDSSCRRAWNSRGVRACRRFMTVAAEVGWGMMNDA